MANIYVDKMQCLGLIDNGCSWTIVDADWCQSWKKATEDIMIRGMSCLCCSIGMVAVSMEEGSLIKIRVLVVQGKLLGFDLLLGIDAIKAFGSIAVRLTGQIQISDRQVAKCAAITIYESDFTATFDHQSWAGLQYGSDQRDTCPKDCTMEYQSSW